MDLKRQLLQTDDKHAKNHSKLFSKTLKIKAIDPFAFYNIKTFSNREKFFWKSDDDTYYIIGLGFIESFTGSETDSRFQNVKVYWDALLSHSHIDNPYDLNGTGPLIFGGFSFDPHSEKEEEWSNFHDFLFYLPAFMLTISEGQYYLTVNAIGNQELLDQRVEEFIRLTENLEQNLIQPVEMRSSEELNVEQWLQSVDDIVNNLNYTSLKKVVLARKMKIEFHDFISSNVVLRNLLMQQPRGFIFSFATDEGCFLGASPERLVKKSENHIYSVGLAGSIARGSNEKEDIDLGNQLLQDDKNLFEHELVVAMVEDALKPYCINIHIPEQPTLLKMPDIQHLFSPVTGKAKSDTSIFDIVEQLHPTPALGGVPTTKAMEVIREKEQMDRGFYAAPIGWADYRGNGEFIVAIRSALMKRNSATLYAGCGLVANSKPQDELLETRIKFQPMIRALRGD